MANMLLLLALVFNTATAYRNVKLNIERTLMALKEEYQIRGNIFNA